MNSIYLITKKNNSNFLSYILLTVKLICVSIILTNCGIQLQVKPPSEFIFVNEISLTFIPQDIAFNNYSNTLYLLKDHNTIYQINLHGHIIQKIGGFGLESGKFTQLTDITTDAIGKLYIVDKASRIITLYDEHVEFIKNYQFPEISEPYLIAVKDDGDILIANSMDNEIYCFDSAGLSENNLHYQLGKFELLQPKVLSVCSNFTYILDDKKNAVFIFDNFGGYIDQISADQSSNILQPQGNIISITSNRNFLYLLDSNKNVFIYHPQYKMKNISSLLDNLGMADCIYSSRDLFFVLCGKKLKVWRIFSH